MRKDKGNTLPHDAAAANLQNPVDQGKPIQTFPLGVKGKRNKKFRQGRYIEQVGT